MGSFSMIRAAVFLLGVAWQIISPGLTHAQYPTANILERVFFVRYGAIGGSAFTIEVGTRQYLVSASHVFPGIKDNQSIEIFLKDGWQRLQVKVLPCEPADVDIVVLALPMQVSPVYPLPLSLDGAIFGQDMFFLGFPYGLGTATGRNPIPFIKKATLSAIEKKKTYQIIWLDGHNNQGFSGGPVVFYDQAARTIKVAGVISGYRYNPDRVIKLKPMPSRDTDAEETDFVVLANSGIIKVFNIRSAVEAIKRRPVGFKVKK